MSSESPSARARGPWLILPVTTAVAVLAATKFGYHSLLMSAFTLKWLIVAALIAGGAFLSSVLEASVGLMVGAAAIAAAVYADEIFSSLQFHESAGALVKYEVWHLVLLALCLATVAVGLQGALSRNPVTRPPVAIVLSAAGAITVLGLLIPPSGSSFSDWNRLSRPGAATFSLLVFLALMGFLLVAVPLHRSQLSRWVVAGVCAPLLVDLVVSLATSNTQQSPIYSGLSLVFFGRPAPLVVVGILGVVGVAIVSFLTSTEIDDAVRSSTPAVVAVGGNFPGFASASPSAAVGLVGVGSVGPPSTYGSIGARFGAMLIDGFISILFLVPGYGLVFLALSANVGPSRLLAPLLILVGPIVNLILYCRNVGRRGQSWGHRACGVRVVDAVTGGPIGVGRAFGRLLMRAIAAIPCYLGLIWALWDPQRRGWHDMVARTVVVPASTALADGVPQMSAAPSIQPPPLMGSNLVTAWSVGSQAPSPSGMPSLLPQQQVVSTPPSYEPSPAMQQVPMIVAPAEQPTVNHSFNPPPAARPILPKFGLVLRFDSGDEAVLNGTVLIGRDPTTGIGDDGVGLIRITDPTMSVSKTHMAIGVGGGEAWVEDRHSTNGVSVVRPQGETLRVDAGRRALVPVGGKVHFGDRWVEVQQR
jgi:uncharacterized RDD family membrane protein YckC